MSTEAYWWITLGAGLVVAAVAVVLLHLLLQQVRRVERASDDIWTAGKRVAGNTATTWMLDLLGEQLSELDAATAQPTPAGRGGAGAGG